MAVAFDYDVAVCGYGPTGQAVTSLLARLGWKVLAFDRHPALYGLPRLATINGEPLRIVALAGDIDLALQESSLVDTFEFRDGDGDLLAALDWSGKHPSGYPRRTSVYQPYLEDTMYRAGTERGAQVELGWACEAFDQDDDAVRISLRAREEASDARRDVTVRYLLGADGANSFVRETLGLKRRDFGYREAWLCLDVRCRRDLGDRFRNCEAKCDPGRTVATIPIGPNRIRFEFIVNPDDDHSELLAPEVGYRMIEEEHGLSQDDIEIYRQVVFPFEGKVAEEWCRGRVFILGDAAHLMPPFLGEGAGAGLRDALNLSWKLHFVLAGKAGGGFLDSYQDERQPHVTQHVLGSIALSELACERDPVKAAERNKNYRTGRIPPPPQEPTLEQGILHLDADGRVTPPTGIYAPQDTVEFQGRTGLLDDLVGWGPFLLLTWGADPSEVLGGRGAELADALGIVALRCDRSGGPDTIVDRAGVLKSFFDEYDVEAVLIRPDFYVFGACGLEEVAELVADLARQSGTADDQVAAVPPSQAGRRS